MARSFYTLELPEKNSGGVLDITEDLDMKKLAIKNLKTYPEDNADATSKKYVDDENAKYLKLDGSSQMTDILDMGDNAIVGVHDTLADNSISSKKYIDDKLATKISFLPGNNVMDHYTFLRGLSFSASRVKNVGTPTQNQDATNKFYVDGELAKKLSLTGGTLSGPLNMGSQKITSLASPTHANDATSMDYVDTQIYLARSTLVALDGSSTMTGKLNMNDHPVSNLPTPLQDKDATPKHYVDARNNYTYHFAYVNLSTTFGYPHIASGFPTYWMYCAGLTTSSYFHLHSMCYDADSNLSPRVLTFQLDFFQMNGTHTSREFYQVIASTVQITGERLLFFDKKFYPSALTNYQNFKIARLGIKSDLGGGNELSVSCSFHL